MNFFLFFLLTYANAYCGSAPDYLKLFENTVSDNSGDIFLLPAHGNFFLDEEELNEEKFQTSHLSSYSALHPTAPKFLSRHAMAMHGIAQPYDTEIPMIFFDEKANWIKSGQFTQQVQQQDIVPTLSELLDVAPPPYATGTSQSRILQKSAKKKPKVIVIFVLDQFGKNYYEFHKKNTPFINSLKSRGASFSRATVGQVDAETVVGHVGISTGTYSRNHSISSNNYFHRGFLTAAPIFTLKVEPDFSTMVFPYQLNSPTLGEWWSGQNNGKAINFSYGGAARAAIGMAGHGKLYNGNSSSILSFVLYKQNMS